MRKSVFLLVVSVCLAAAVYGQQTTEGTLYAVGKQGAKIGNCPLKSTAVKADISGFIARVSVRQEFENSFTEPIEAVYVFPLSQNGAVDAMTMTVGDRAISGKIMRREEARQVYDAAKSEGKMASLLDQERTNIFTQSVANIMPGERVVVEITYVETLKYEAGAYEFVFPMTVAPRYIPAAGVADAARVSQPVAATRNGSDVTIEVNLNAGVPVEDIRSSSHDINQINLTPNLAKIALRDEKVIPNKDFILRYDVTGKRIEDAVLTHHDERGGFFTLILQPPDKVATEDRTPKEIVFVLDTSGSMDGFPIEKAKEAMKLSLDGLYPDDTFNLITFAGDTAILFDKPVAATRANLDAAQAFLAARQGYGGTEMMKAIKAALEPSDASDHLRIVCFMTDGEVGNDDEIVAEVQRHPNARVFSFGIGQSVNRALLDKIASEGKGEAEYVGLQDDGSAAAKRFYERVRTPMLTDISVDWNGMAVADVYPKRIADLFSAKPVILNGRYTKGGRGVIRLKGMVGGQPMVREINVDLPENSEANPALPTLWARTRIDELSMARLNPASKTAGKDLDDQITSLGLDFGLMTAFTSFVAVEDRLSNSGGTPKKVLVPSVLPEGMDPANADVGAHRGSGIGQGSGNGAGAGFGFGFGNGSASSTSSSNVVTVNGGTAAAVDVTTTQLSTNITTRAVQQLPRGTAFGSLLRTVPNVKPVALAGGFRIDGANGPENSFQIDGQEVSNFRTGTLNAKHQPKIDGGVVDLEVPAYPSAAKSAHASGLVRVNVRIDTDGKVTSATAVEGDRLLRAECERAASASKFAPAFFNGRGVRFTGDILYLFSRNGKFAVVVRNMKAEPPTPDERRVSALTDKLHFWLFDLVKRLGDGSTPGANESLFVHDGKADIQVSVRTNSPAVMEKLKSAGFELSLSSGTRLAGRIPIAGLARLAEIDEVLLITPRI
jgi:Ca-activated chloride channel homolog